jgi:pimeloyl-ACP methyl ester carboxylesterase
MSLARVFIHGFESSNRGTKGVFFKQRYPDMIIEDFHGSLPQRMRRLNALLANNTSLTIVGSSFGGLMAAMYACDNPGRVRKLVLLAPALTFPEFEPYLQHQIDIPVVIYHGKEDDVIRVVPVHEVARMVFSNLGFNTVDDDHALRKTFKGIDWDDLLETKPAPARA